MDKAKRAYILSLWPILDKKRKFLFMPIAKSATRAISRLLLKDRIIHFKSGIDKHKEAFNSYSDEELEVLFSFAIVRNPWDRLVSFFFYMLKEKPEILGTKDFKTFVMGKLAEEGTRQDEHLYTQHSRLYYKGEPLVEFFGRFESIKKDWAFIARKIGAPAVLPVYGASRHKNFQSYYDQDTIAVVNDLYRDDIEAFGYSFE